MASCPAHGSKNSFHRTIDQSYRPVYDPNVRSGRGRRREASRLTGADAVPAGSAQRMPSSRAATGLHSQALGPAARSWLTGVARSRSRKRGPYAVQRHRGGAPRGARMFREEHAAQATEVPRLIGAPRPRLMSRE